MLKLPISVSVLKLQLNCIKTETSKNWNQFTVTLKVFISNWLLNCMILNSYGPSRLQYNSAWDFIFDSSWKFITNCDKLQHPTAVLLQNTTKFYYKMRQVFYCKMRHLLQSVSAHDEMIKVTSRSGISKTIYHNRHYYIVIWKVKMTKFRNFISIIPLTLK